MKNIHFEGDQTVMTMLKAILSSKEAVLDFLESRKDTEGEAVIVIRLMSGEERNSLGVPEDSIAWVHALKKDNKPIFYGTFDPSTKIFAMLQAHPLESPFITPQELMESTFEDVKKELEKRHREMIPESEKIKVTIMVGENLDTEHELFLTKREERWQMGKKQIIYDVHGSRRRQDVWKARKKLVESGKYPEYEITSRVRHPEIIFEEKQKEKE